MRVLAAAPLACGSGREKLFRMGVQSRCRDQQVEEKRERERRAADEERAADAAMEAERLRALKLQLVRC